MESSNKFTLIKYLINVIRADGKLHENEIHFLHQTGQNLGFDIEDINGLLVTNANLVVEQIPEKEPDRMQILYHLLFAIKFDKKVSDDEIHLVNFLGLKLGFQPEMVEEMSMVMKDNIGQIVPPNALIDIIKKYMN